jgi:NAD(P)H-hydrate epimerase
LISVEGIFTSDRDRLRDWRSGVTPDEMRTADRLAERSYRLTPILLMEVAGLATARVARSILGTPLSGRAISILAGPGNNGGDGLVAARRLAGWGARVSVITSYNPDAARDLSRVQLHAVESAGIDFGGWRGKRPESELLVDALLGFGANGPARGAIAEMIESVNTSGVLTLAVDVPSGLDAGLGTAPGTCVVAGATVTLALAKTGLLTESARRFVGELYLADIGLPRALWAQLGIDVAGLFDAGDVLHGDGTPVT